ncbi:protein kinase domain-containing protein [Actinocrinis sp.]|uniref:protein kinase domain-containing protein n=1 Tax=Actinocrinis sp. TaxID=1920516 RepID=UPI002D648B31|nr:protein kinase [Actinocrinis sp.]HZP53364.1 protein kinase [Actinocrinis sp.]
MSGEVGAGSRLGSLYVLDQRIGGGSMGTVWSAHHTETGEAVAVKILSDTMGQNSDLVGRFLRERSALLSVRHPYLVEIKDVVIENERIALVMELVEGVDAARLLDQNGPMSLYHAARLGDEIAQALTAVHAAGIVHRDLQPANILVENATGRAKLVDFGIAWIAGNPRLTASNSVIGTPHYLAPELLTGGAVSPAADVYSLAVCLYQLLTGVLPFDGEHYAQILYKHLHEAPPPHPAIPPTIWGLFEAMLAKDPAQRPTTQFVAGQLAMFARSEAPLQVPPEPVLAPAPEQQQMQPVATPVPAQGPAPAPLNEDSPLYSSVPPPFGEYGPTPASDSWHESTPPPPASDSWHGGTPPMPVGYATPPPFTYAPPQEAGRSRKRVLVIASVCVLALGGVAVGAWALTKGGGSPKPLAGASASATTHSASPSPSPLTVAQQRIDRWPLIGDASDAIGGHDGVATGVKWTVTDSTHGSAAFTGESNSQIVVQGGPVLSTSHSFTIAVWVVMNGPTTTPSGWETVVALRGTTSEGAALEYNASANRWAFDMAAGDSAAAATDSVLSHAAPSKTSWYHLVATYDATDHTMKLYVNKALQGSGSHAPNWTADGTLSIGSGISHGEPTNWLRGAVSDVQLWKIPLNQDQIDQLG